jgi:hypothetical protein
MESVYVATAEELAAHDRTRAGGEGMIEGGKVGDTEHNSEVEKGREEE